ncbi:MAG: hypothetical protein RLZZ628_3824 [Bacteroidota bacterium]|jgi:hypothetical protein
MKNLIFLIFLILTSCDKNNKLQLTKRTTKDLEIQFALPQLSTEIKDSTNFSSFVNLFKSTYLPCSTKVINHLDYITAPFDKNISYLNILNDSLIAQIKPKNTPCDYFDVCSKFSPLDLKNRYDSLANKFHATKLRFNTKKFVIVLCKSRTIDDDIYLLTYTNLGVLLSSIQTDMRCVNKVANLSRRSYIDKNLNIFITDFQKDNQCDKAGFKVRYHYKISNEGIIYKVKETLTILDNIDIDEFINFWQEL